LPHWRQTNATYFVTWRLKPNTPTLNNIERDIVRSALLYFDRVRFDHFASVVMDDHVHALVTPYASQSLDAIVKSWKSFSARRITELGERSGRVWQREFFDRIIRNEVEFQRTLAYIKNNPVKRWPGTESYRWLDMTGLEAGVTSE
jgi:REP element-mobilizing transposase RayT